MIAAGLVLTAAAGIVAGLILLAIGMVRGLGTSPDLISPSAYRDERHAASPARTGEFKPDRAWPLYPFRQARADLAKVWEETAACYRALWKWPADAFYTAKGGSPVGWWIVFPIPVAITICLLTAGLAAPVLYCLFALVSLACAAVMLTGFIPAALILRAAEAARQRALRTQASCPRCFHVTPWPAYRCPGCSALHRDMRPGRLGLIMRRCECGAMLPTMALRAGWRLKAACQRCRKALPPGAGAIRDVRITVFGDAAAGKTRFLHAALSSLNATAQRAGIALDFVDQSSREQVESGLERLRSGQDTPRTPATPPTALSLRVGTGARSALVHLFDTAGQRFRDPQAHDSLGFLDHSHGLVFVIDPFTLEAVHRMLADRADRHGQRPAADPEAAYGEVVERLRDSGVTAGAQRLAVLVAKADLLQAAGVELPVSSDQIAEWLMRSGAHNLVLSARREFADARFFVVTSQAAGHDGRPHGPHDPGTPLRWLLRSHGVRLPAETETGRRSASERLGETTGARS
jgi:Double-GTPase 2